PRCLVTPRAGATRRSAGSAAARALRSRCLRRVQSDPPRTRTDVTAASETRATTDRWQQRRHREESVPRRSGGASALLLGGRLLRCLLAGRLLGGGLRGGLLAGGLLAGGLLRGLLAALLRGRRGHRGLPQPEARTGRIEEDREGAHVDDGHVLDQDRGAELARLLDRVLQRAHADVGQPRARLAGIHLPPMPP